MPAGIDIESLLLIGRIWRPHGVCGEVKVVPDTDDPDRFADLSTVYTGTSWNTAGRKNVESVRFQPTKKGVVVVLKLKGVDSREDADALRRHFVFAAEDELPPLAEDEYFLHDLVGLTAEAEDGTVIGIVDDVLELPAQEMLVIRREHAAAAMVPAVPEFVLDIDLDAEKIVIRPIEGLLE